MKTHAPLLATTIALLALSSQASAQLMNKTVDVDGVTRQYLMYLPAGYTGATDLPVMFIYHGGDMTSQAMLAMTDWRPLADAHQFIAVYPQGLPDNGGSPIWNSVGPWSNGVDEIGFTDEMIDDLDAQFAVDQSRVYACGYSNGGNLVWELGCFLSDRIAAVGAVAGSMWEWTEDLCTPTRAFPIVSIHGTFDFYNPWSGGPPFSLGLIAASEYWAQHMGADPVPTIVDIPNTVPGDGSTVDHHTWAGGNDCTAVEHYKVVNGGHDWPGIFGNMDIDSNEVLWEFCSRYSLDGSISSVNQLGVGAGGANIGTLDLPHAPSLGELLTFDYNGFDGASGGVFLLSLQNIDLAAFGGQIFPNFANPLLILPVTTSAAGAGSLALPLGFDPVLLGLTGYAQVGIADGAQAAGLAFSNGIEFTICN